jgi:hypothetical protein
MNETDMERIDDNEYQMRVLNGVAAREPRRTIVRL